MNLSVPGRNILEAEVTNISKHGIWLLVNGKEYFLPCEQFPWFKNKKLDDVMNVQLFGKNHLYWENLDIDLSLEMIEHPERFPLQARAS